MLLKTLVVVAILALIADLGIRASIIYSVYKLEKQIRVAAKAENILKMHAIDERIKILSSKIFFRPYMPIVYIAYIIYYFTGL